MTTLPSRANLFGLGMTAALLAAMTPCHGVDTPLAPQVQGAIAAFRNNRAGADEVFDSSTLGKTASPVE